MFQNQVSNPHESCSLYDNDLLLAKTLTP